MIKDCYLKDANIESDNLHCILALIAVDYIQKYLDIEEERCSDIEWKDKKGYSFNTDIGYFFDGLVSLENCLIERLRGGTIE